MVSWQLATPVQPDVLKYRDATDAAVTQAEVMFSPTGAEPAVTNSMSPGSAFEMVSVPVAAEAPAVAAKDGE